MFTYLQLKLNESSIINIKPLKTLSFVLVVALPQKKQKLN